MIDRAKIVAAASTQRNATHGQESKRPAGTLSLNLSILHLLKY